MRKKLPIFLMLLCILSLSCCGEKMPERHLSGARILLVGDSLFTGFGVDDYRNTWMSMLEEKDGLVLEICSTAGSTLTSRGMDPICMRNLPDGTYDIILIDGGVNDWAANAALKGSTTDSMEGALKTLAGRIGEKYPDAVTGYFLGWRSDGRENSLGLTTDDYLDAAEELSRSLGISCYQGNDPEVSGIDPLDKMNREMYLQNDPWHLNEAGHVQVYSSIRVFLQSLLADGLN